MNRLTSWWLRCSASPRARIAGERGANVLEYAMLLALIVVVCLIAVTYVGESTSERFSSTASQVP